MMTAQELEVLIAAFPDSRIDHDSKWFFEGLMRRELRIDRCSACDRWRHPPAPICPACWSQDVVHEPVGGTGRVHLHTVYRVSEPVTGAADPDGTTMVTVVLDEQDDLLVTGIFRGRSRPVCGDRVRLDWESLEMRPLPVFVPEEHS